jgi:hypothetical protein
MSRAWAMTLAMVLPAMILVCRRRAAGPRTRRRTGRPRLPGRTGICRGRRSPRRVSPCSQRRCSVAIDAPRSSGWVTSSHGSLQELASRCDWTAQSSRTGHRGRRAGQGLPGVAGARRFLRPRPRAASRRPRRPGLGTPRGSLSTLGSGLVAGPGLSAQRASTGSARATTRTVREHHPEPPEGKHGDTDVD